MGLMTFFKDAGEKLFGKGPAKAAQEAAAAAPSPETIAALNATAAKAIADHVAAQGLSADGLDIAFDGASSTVTVAGTVESSEQREKMVLAVGNIAGVSAVEDALHISAPKPPSVFYTVQPGDSLSKIAKAHYGDAMKYPVIFEANKPMLKDPDKIFPGQVLRIPPLQG